MVELTKLLIFSLLISFSLSIKIKPYEYKTFIKENITGACDGEAASYNISYNIGDITKNYIKIKIKSKNENQFLFAYYSPISPERNYSYLLNSGKEEIYLYINKAFTKLEAKGNIYLSIDCFGENCSFIVTPTEVEFIDLERNSQYKYFTTKKKNLENTFFITAKKEEIQPDYISFFASGNKNIEMHITYVNKDQKMEINSNSFDNGKYAIFKEEGDNLDNNYYIIKVTAPANNLITFGTNVNFKKERKTKFIVNTNEIYGVLTKESNIQCFDLNIGLETNSYLSILDFNENLQIKYNNTSKFPIIVASEKGFILKTINKDFYDNSFCLLRNESKSSKDSPFSLQITSNITNNYYKNIFSPQINGVFYERYLEKGTFAFFTGLYSIDFKKELRYYLKKREGYPQMYIVKCTTYPNCKFDTNFNKSTAINTTEINDIFSYSIFKTDIKKLIDPEQYVLFVYCNSDSNCKFQTNFYSELDKIVLPKDERTYHTIMYQGENNFLIKLNGEKNLEQIYVHFLTYSGDISIEIEYNKDNYNAKRFLTGNKKYFIIDVNDISDEINDEINFTVNGKLASFYSADYKLIKNDEDRMTISEESGINYLEIIDINDIYKNISLKNRRKAENRSFAVNFFPLNCEINVIKTTLENNTLQTLGSLIQDVILNNSEIYEKENYEYIMSIIKMENVTVNETNLCMVYLSSIEINVDSDKEYQKRHLLVSETVINRVILNKDVPNIEYIYPHMNPKGYIAINFNWQTKSKVTIIININKKEYKKFETTQSQYTIIPEKDLRSSNYCPYNETKPNQVCSIIVQIKLDSEYYDDEPIIKFSIKSQEVIPAFIKKSMIRKDIVVGNYYQYFYTEVGFQEDGDINIKFDRGSGKVYGRIVSKDTNENQGWMDRIILPDENNNDLIYNYYTKRLYYASHDTESCNQGCYLILKVEPNFSDDYFKSENIAYPITLSLMAMEGMVSPTQDNITVVDIPLNEFIVGDTNPTYEIFRYCYSLFIPYDCEKLMIEFLCESSYIFINVGDIIPRINKSDFSYKVMNQDGILEITKREILDKLSNKNIKDSIKNVQLTIAIGAQYLDNGFSSVFSFRIRALRNKGTELISLTTDQETLCKLNRSNGNCYFIIPENIIDEHNNIFFHAIFLPNVEFNYYANEVPKEKITDRDENILQGLLPTKKNNKWSNNNSRANYLYIDYSEIENKTNHYILLNLEVNSPDNDGKEKIITLLHSFYSYKGIILPNPASAQLFLVNNNNKNELKFKFSSKEHNLLIRLKSVSGKGVVYWNKSDDTTFDENIDKLPLNSNDENTYFFFNAPGDSITLTFSKKEDGEFPLHFQNMLKNKGNDSNESPGFGFYCIYERESEDDNYNYINFGENSKYNYINTDFPFIFYSMLPDKNHTIDVNIHLTSLIKKYSRDNNNLVESEDIVQLTPLYDEFNISGTIVNENKIYSKNTYPSIENEMEKGEYDPINKILKIQFTSEYIKNKNIAGNNYIYIKIDKENYNMKFEEVTMEISVLPSNNIGYIVEKDKYIYGKIPFKQQGYNRYELSRINKYYKYMRIEFSSNNNNIAFTLNEFKLNDDISKIDFYRNRTHIITDKINNGKSVSIIKFNDDETRSVFISVFNTKNNHFNDQSNLSNFVFNYNVSYENNFLEINPERNVLDTTQDKNRSIMNITLPKIQNITEGNKVNYIFKLFKNNSADKNEKFDSIALTDTKAIRIYKKSITYPPPNDNIVTLTDIHNDTDYFVIGIVEVLVGANYKELFSYLCLEKKEEKKESNTKVIILCSVLGGVVLIGIIFLIYCLVLKKGNLIKSKKLEQLTKKMNSDSSLNLNSVD